MVHLNKSHQSGHMMRGTLVRCRTQNRIRNAKNIVKLSRALKDIQTLKMPTLQDF